MKRCTSCESTNLKRGTVEERLSVGDAEFVANLPAVVCQGCKDHFVEAADMERFDMAIATWLTSHGQRTAEAFRFIRKALGMRATDLAKLVGVTAETISHWENGHRPADVGAFALLGELVADRIEGKDGTLNRLRAIQNPVKAPKRAVRVELPKAG